LLSNPKLKATLGKAALKYAKNKWTDAVQAERMIAFYKEVIKTNNR
jgi:hypothetical protein